MIEKQNNIKITNAWLCQVKDKSIVPIFADVVIGNGKIKEIIERDFDQFIPGDNISNSYLFDACGRVVTIPNINFHDHFYSRLAKGLNVTGDTSNFHNILKNLWWKLDLALDLEMVKASAQMAALESIRNGVTYIFDHHASPNATNSSMKVIADVLDEFNLCGVLCFESSDRNGKKLSDEAIEENLTFFQNHTSESVRALFGLHASFTLDDDSLSKISKIVNETGLGIHIHLCEDKIDRDLSISSFGDSPVDRLVKFDLLNGQSILAHGIHLTEEDFLKLENLGCAIAYNPDSNFNNAVGIPEYSKVLKSIPILCGTDGMHSNPIRSIKQLFLLYRHQQNSFKNSFEWIQKIYFDQLNFVKKFFSDFTSLQARDKADLIVWDYVPPAPFNSQNFFGHWIYGITERPVHSVLQEGKFLMKSFQIQEIDEVALNREIYEQGKRLSEKVMSRI
jgi:cytosine/adenosine deaminase-related metal-dependent hydrolase